MNRIGTILISLIVVAGVAGFIFSCGGGGGDGSTAVLRLAFYTSTEGTGDLSSWAEVSGSGLTGLDAADGICQARAEAAGLSGTFVAWLSDDNNDAYCRVHGLTGKKAANCGQAELPTSAGPWFRTDGAPFADRIDLLVDSDVIYTPMRYNEIGNAADSVFNYWTGTDRNGVAFGENCIGWTDSTVLGTLVTYGSTYLTTVRWSYSGQTNRCDNSSNLLCLETGSDNVQTIPTMQGKKVFLSSAQGSARLGSWAESGGNTGIAAGDAICQSLAATAGLANAGSFKAWLSDSSTNAIDRLTSDGPWVRVDGILVAYSKSALVNTWLFTSLSVTEDAQHLNEEDCTWTGTLSDGSKSSALCSDWISASGSVIGHIGITNTVTGSWTEAGAGPCSWTSWRLYCFED